MLFVRILKGSKVDTLKSEQGESIYILIKVVMNVKGFKCNEDIV